MSPRATQDGCDPSEQEGKSPLSWKASGARRKSHRFSGGSDKSSLTLPL